MMTTAVMLFVYLGYLALRSAIVDPVVRARRAAILGTIAVIPGPTGLLLGQYLEKHSSDSISPA